VSRFSSRCAGFAASIATIALSVAGCDLGTVNVPATTPQVVVHAVLNPGATGQVMLLERTLSGTTTVPDTSFDPSNPIATAGGIPISGAVAEIIDSTGRTFRAVEDKLVSTGTGASGRAINSMYTRQTAKTSRHSHDCRAPVLRRTVHCRVPSTAITIR
jgi:hypothetical protein